MRFLTGTVQFGFVWCVMRISVFTTLSICIATSLNFLLFFIFLDDCCEGKEKNTEKVHLFRERLSFQRQKKERKKSNTVTFSHTHTHSSIIIRIIILKNDFYYTSYCTEVSPFREYIRSHPPSMGVCDGAVFHDGSPPPPFPTPSKKNKTVV